MKNLSTIPLYFIPRNALYETFYLNEISWQLITIKYLHMNMFSTFVRFIKDITREWQALFKRRCADDLLTRHIFVKSENVFHRLQKRRQLSFQIFLYSYLLFLSCHLSLGTSVMKGLKVRLKEIPFVI